MHSATGLLGPVPIKLEQELFTKFQEIERNFREGRWEPSELNGGKLCEVVYTILRGHLDGAFPPAAAKPSNFLDACRALEKEPTSFGRSVRIQIPRMLAALYEVRNNRGVGHVGGDVDPNRMDAMCVIYIAKWIVSELVRVFHGVTTEEATQIVETICEREIPIVWDTGTVKRVLDTKLSMLQKTLVLLYSSPQPQSEADLVRSIEHSNPSIYRRDVLRRAHERRLLEYDKASRLVRLSPLGARMVEDDILTNSRV